MTRQTTERGYAKINLHLDMTGRMANGYHRVETVMQTVSLYDEVTVTLTEDGTLCASCAITGVPTDEKNIAVRAAALFLGRIGASEGVRIHIEKQIPMAAGMAGGSADAAATLRCLNRLYGEPLTVAELCELGATLGADVPFCIMGGTAYADGRGDRLHPFPAMPDCHIVCACEGEGVSTPWAYRLLDSLYDNFEEGGSYRPVDTDGLKQALTCGTLTEIARSLYNIFETPILRERPVAAELRSLLLENGAVGAMMSGSGPSVFGLFDSECAAENAAEALRQKGYRPYLCRPIVPYETK
ncbi:MAG: 4-(cytidine 5'-diphospho)-2-C-methyl-D-erythritol kinase [Ruminococcaceae bacterium]|nr:4-(cytidine 5'-diphospho)-2-C-methyl-D-erythritol kinase [Oscillospiraceae bacterium]